MQSILDKPKSIEEKKTRTVVDTLCLTPETVQRWDIPKFQRIKKVNGRVREVAEEIRRTNIIPGILTLGYHDRQIYIVDGQHRVEAFLLSGVQECFADVRTIYFGSIPEMAAEFKRLNSSLVKMRPDDVLRAAELSNVHLRSLRSACPFVGYDNVRRNGDGPILSMSCVLRSWNESKSEIPGTNATSAERLADALTSEESVLCSRFLLVCLEAWGRDPEYNRLWGNLNLTICAWLYRRVVLTQHSSRTYKLDDAAFTKAAMSLSASGGYLDWLVGRLLNDRDRAPCYSRVTSIMGKRLHDMDGCRKANFPRPPWSLGRKGRAV